MNKRAVLVKGLHTVHINVFAYVAATPLTATSNMVQGGVSVGDLQSSSTCVRSEDLQMYEVTPQHKTRKSCPDFILSFTGFFTGESFLFGSFRELWCA